MMQQILIALLLVTTGATAQSTAPEITEIGRGVWRLRYGAPESFTPCAFRAAPPAIERLAAIGGDTSLPFDLADIACDIRPARTVVKVPCDERESHIYGFGLDPGALNQRGLRKWLTVSASVEGKMGVSHGPAPFYVSTAGYGIYVDTARVPLVHVARLDPKANAVRQAERAGAISTSEAELYAAREVRGRNAVVFDVPGNSTGIDVYVFAGPTLREAVQRYNLFSGGGCVPPLWGLGQKYRTHSKAEQAEVLKLAQSFRDMDIPCDMFGLEPGWQTHAYSCSLAWSPERFPDHQHMVDTLNGLGFKVNLWEHAYIHPTSPLFSPLLERSGDYLVWGGLVVDFADAQASDIFSRYHETELIDHGIRGFKADECDRQFITDVTPFNYPYASAFPSSIDGDQMTQLYGYLYQQSILDAFKRKNQRTMGDVRATTALAAPLPFCLYSDAYSFDEYLRQLVNASFSGLLWSPEVREAPTREELLNRIAMASLAPQMCLNVWFMPHPVWEQYERGANERHELLPEEEQHALAARIREITNLRMALLPYLYAAFYRYHLEGLPPVRALALEFPEDRAVRDIDDEYMFGDLLLVAPFIGTATEREVYLPTGGDWVDFRTNEVHPGGSTITKHDAPGNIPLFVKMNSILPLAEPVEFVAEDTVFQITARVYGDKPAPFTLYEDDGTTFAYEDGAFGAVTLAWKDGAECISREGEFAHKRYAITGWNTLP